MTEGKIAKDPVCGMEVNINSSTSKTIYNGVEYYFCAPGCLKQFEKNPETFVNAADETSVNHGHQHHGDHCSHGHHHN